MIAQDKDATGFDGGCQMAAADVPGKLGEMRRVARANVVKLLRRRADHDQATVLQHQPVAVAERNGLRQVDQNLAAIGQFDGAAAQMPLVMREDSLANDLACRAAGGRDGDGARQFGEVGVEGEFHEKRRFFSNWKAAVRAASAPKLAQIDLVVAIMRLLGGQAKDAP